MSSLAKFFLISALATFPAAAQRAQIGVKGHVREGGKAAAGPATRNPQHLLPRRSDAELELPTNPDELERQKLLLAAQPIPALPEDRTHRLVRIEPATQPAAPLLAMSAGPSLYPLPRPLGNTELPAGVPPAFLQVAEGDRPAAVQNRWRIGMPNWRRYESPRIDAIYAKQHWWDPFNQNTLKGDFPFFGRKNFLNFTGVSDTVVETRRLPVASGVSTASPGEFGFFGRGDQLFIRQDFRLSLDLFRGSAGFEPVEREFRFTPQFNINYLLAREDGITNIDVRQGIRRTDAHAGIQEAFFEQRLFTNSSQAFQSRREGDNNGSAYYDFTSIRMGIQRFTSDFRGFIFSDEQPGARLFGNLMSNRMQYNLAFFSMLEKDTNSGLNTFDRRHQNVYIANLYIQDFLTPGYTGEFSLHYNNDQAGFHLDRNGFLVRPQPVGIPVPHKVRAAYAGFTGDGHIGRINISNAFYQAFGSDDNNPIPAMKNRQHINAQLAALELSYDRDWLRYKVSFFYTSGDGKMNDGRARGFDSIVDNQNFAGGGFLNNGTFADRGFTNPVFEGGGINLFNRQSIPLTGTGLQLVSFNSLMPTMRSSKDEGQANFINPGIWIFNAGTEAKLTPKLRMNFNANYLRFDRTEVLEALLFQSHIRREIGYDFGLGLQYRPLLSENIVFTGGIGLLKPGTGFKDIYTSQVLYSGFLQVRLLF